MRKSLIFILLACSLGAEAQQTAGKLTVEKIMRDPKWIGSSPSNPMWSADGKCLYFSWNPDKDPSDSLYFISKDNKVPTKASTEQKKQFVTYESIVYNQARTAYTYAKEGDIFFTDLKSGKTRCIIKSTDVESNPQFSFSDKKVVYTRLLNLYAWDIKEGETTQITRIQNESSAGAKGPKDKANTETPQEKWLNQDQLQTFDILRERKNKRDATDNYNTLIKDKELRNINIDDKRIQNLSISFDGRFVCFRLTKNAAANKNTIVPNYVTESGFTTDIPGRTKVGEIPGTSEMFVYDRLRDSLFSLKTTDLPGIKDQPDYFKDYPKLALDSSKKKESRLVNFGNALWSPKGNYLMLDIRSQDNKDRWLMAWDSSSGKMELADRQRDEAWVGGAGNGNKGWIDDSTFWFQSEATGFAHLYTLNLKSGVKKALTNGNYEVQDVQLSSDKRNFYLTTNQVHPGEKHFYRLPVTGGKSEKLTVMQGANLALLSPDEKMIALLYSYSTKPTELYIQENETGKTAIQITDKAQSAEFKSYEWQDPQVITFKARDGADVYSRIYIPANPDPKKPAVLFVHGAGYLQNAHKWWSSYFREFMFNQMLVK